MIRSHWELDVYKMSVEAAMHLFHIDKVFFKGRTYSLTDQIPHSP